MFENNGRIDQKKLENKISLLIELAEINRHKEKTESNLLNILVNNSPITPEGLSFNKITDKGFKTSTLEPLDKCVNYLLKEFDVNLKEYTFGEISEKYKIDEKLLKDYYYMKDKGYTAGKFINFWRERKIFPKDRYKRNKIKGAYIDLILRNINICKLEK